MTLLSLVGCLAVGSGLGLLVSSVLNAQNFVQGFVLGMVATFAMAFGGICLAEWRRGRQVDALVESYRARYYPDATETV